MIDSDIHTNLTAGVHCEVGYSIKRNVIRLRFADDPEGTNSLCLYLSVTDAERLADGLTEALAKLGLLNIHPVRHEPPKPEEMN